MDGERPAASDDPLCPACANPIRRTDPVVYSHGDLVHAHCSADVLAVADATEDFLRQDGDRWLCEACLAKRLRVDGALVARAVRAMRERGRVQSASAMCAGCRERRPSLRVGGSPPK
jgi:hypothetical protein